MHLILSRKVELVKVPWFRQNDYGPIVNYWQPNFLPIPSQFTLFVLMHFYASLHLSRTIKISKTRTWSYLELTVWCMQKTLFTTNNKSKKLSFRIKTLLSTSFSSRFHACLTFQKHLHYSLYIFSLFMLYWLWIYAWCIFPGATRPNVWLMRCVGKWVTFRLFYWGTYFHFWNGQYFTVMK